MPNVLDKFEWVLPEAQELHIVLCEIYPTPKGAGFIAEKNGIKAGFFNPDQPGFFVWKDILDLAKNMKIVRPLVQFVYDNNKTNDHAGFLADLLADRPVMMNARGVADGDANVGEQEALLFHDDLMLSSGRIEWLVKTLTGLQAVSPAICRFVCNYKQASATGTGFRIGPDMLLTNWHVLHEPKLDIHATSVIAQFSYEQDAAGKPLTSTDIPCDVATIVVGDKKDDWGVIRVAAPMPDSIPTIKLSEAVDPVAQDPAFVIQHPNGNFKRIGYVRNQVSAFDDQFLYYLTDTQSGSSGSPVLDDRCRLVGLHHFGGVPQEVAGRPPLKKNRGVRIPRVIAGLRAAHVAFD